MRSLGITPTARLTDSVLNIAIRDHSAATRLLAIEYLCDQQVTSHQNAPYRFITTTPNIDEGALCLTLLSLRRDRTLVLAQLLPPLLDAATFTSSSAFHVLMLCRDDLFYDYVSILVAEPHTPARKVLAAFIANSLPSGEVQALLMCKAVSSSQDEDVTNALLYSLYNSRIRSVNIAVAIETLMPALDECCALYAASIAYCNNKLKHREVMVGHACNSNATCRHAAIELLKDVVDDVTIGEIERLSSVVADKDVELRIVTAELMGLCGKKATGVLSVLKEQLAKEDVPVRDKLRQAIAMIDNETAQSPAK